MSDLALWRVYFWVDGVGLAVPVNAPTQREAKKRARRLLQKITTGQVDGSTQAYLVVDEGMEARCVEQ